MILFLMYRLCTKLHCAIVVLWLLSLSFLLSSISATIQTSSVFYNHFKTHFNYSTKCTQLLKKIDFFYNIDKVHTVCFLICLCGFLNFYPNGMLAQHSGLFVPAKVFCKIRLQLNLRRLATNLQTDFCVLARTQHCTS